MGLKNWWSNRIKADVKADVRFFWEEYLQKNYAHEYMDRCIQAHKDSKKPLKQQFFPRKGEDLLAKKAAFVSAYSKHEKAFREEYLSWGNNDYNPLACQYSDALVQRARLNGQKKWQMMIQIAQKRKTR